MQMPATSINKRRATGNAKGSNSGLDKAMALASLVATDVPERLA
jgi:hypothetical protein